MSTVGLVAGVLVAFFIAGIAAGVIAVIALSVLKRRPRPPRDDWRTSGRRHFGQAADGIGWQEPPGLDDERDGADGYGDEPPRWPGG